VNDAGNQVNLFGKSINARYMQLCVGEENYEFPEDGYHGEDIKELAKKIYETEGDGLKTLPEQERVEKFIAFGLPFNIALMKEHLERYRIRFDEWFHESTLHESGYVTDTLNKLDEAGLLYEADGALWLKNTQLGADKDEVLRKSNGFYTYYTMDIAYHRNKLERGFDKAIDIWGADHHGHVVRLRITLASPELGKALGMDGTKLELILMQMVRLLRDGETVKVSKRTGKALTLNDLLDEISIDACRFFFNARPDSHLDFDMGLAVRQDSENPVYYVQYAHARICSLISILAGEGFTVPKIGEINPTLLKEETEQELIKQISQLPEEIRLASRDYDPSRINKYVIELAARFHKFYNACRIKGEERELLLARLKLADLTRIVIKNSLDVLGVTAPEKM
jgi:arginyl-tRNA synthetase